MYRKNLPAKLKHISDARHVSCGAYGVQFGVGISERIDRSRDRATVGRCIS